MCWPDAAGGKDIGVFSAALIHRGDDRILDIRNDAGFHQPYASAIQLISQIREVFVLRAAGQDFISDNDKACGTHAAYIAALPWAFQLEMNSSQLSLECR